jgi:hypothetical protein
MPTLKQDQILFIVAGLELRLPVQDFMTNQLILLDVLDSNLVLQVQMYWSLFVGSVYAHMSITSCALCDTHMHSLMH